MSLGRALTVPCFRRPLMVRRPLLAGGLFPGSVPPHCPSRGPGLRSSLVFPGCGVIWVWPPSWIYAAAERAGQDMANSPDFLHRSGSLWYLRILPVFRFLDL
ncbi:hypothetical protein NDU88_003986 [Pleurodeles waltl]|uniref:Uncharacterized protein n=1 Tax=Pleurodeles waltl TaxID=8319 RepID=A0AAV7VHI9_PLEWA|nr:hypothetical protein NDU88_003986 [Pleurodeles waltl]